MTVPYRVKPIKLELSKTTFNDSLRVFFGGKPKDFMMNAGQHTPLKTKHEMPTLEDSEDWPKLTEYDLSQAHVKPTELNYKAAFKQELEKQTKLKNKAIEELHEYMDEYRKLDKDLRNEISKNRRLQTADGMNVLLMKQNLELREQLGAME